MRIVVTGAAGFIGSTLCERLVREGNEVLGLDAFIPYYDPGRKEANLASLRAESSFSFQSLDLRVDDLRPVLDGADVVVHEAAMPGLPKSWTEFELYTTCNLIGTQRLAEACHQVGVRRLVHASTSSVYGAQAVGAEDMPKRPVSPYGVTKLAAESLLQAYVQSFDLPVVVLRYFSIYGPRQRPDMAFHIFIERIRRAEAISVYGDGLQSRSFTFVDDCVAGTVAAIERGRLGETYNIGGGEAVTLRRAIELIGATLGTEPKIDHLPSRAGDQRETLADTTKAQRELGYEPSVSMADGLARQVGWHLREMPA